MTELHTRPMKSDLDEYLSKVASQPMPARINPEHIVSGRSEPRSRYRLMAVATVAAAAVIAIVGVTAHRVLGIPSIGPGPATGNTTPTPSPSEISSNNCTATGAPSDLPSSSAFGNVAVRFPATQATAIEPSGAIAWASPPNSGPGVTVSFPGTGGGAPLTGTASAAANTVRSQAMQRGAVVSVVEHCSIGGYPTYFFSATDLQGGQFYEFFIANPAGAFEVIAGSPGPISGQNLHDVKLILGSIKISGPPPSVPFGSASATFTGALAGTLTSVGPMPANELGESNGYPTPPQVCHPSGDFAAWTGSVAGQSGRVEVRISGQPGMLQGSAGSGPFSLHPNPGITDFAVTVMVGSAQWTSQSGTVSLRTNGTRGGTFTAHMVPATPSQNIPNSSYSAPPVPSTPANTASGNVDVTGTFACQ